MGLSLEPVLFTKCMNTVYNIKSEFDNLVYISTEKIKKLVISINLKIPN